MCLHSGTVDEDVRRCASGGRESMEKAFPDSLGSPSDIAVVESLPRPVVGRCVDPTPARLQDVDDTADDPTVIDPRLSARVARQVRRDPLELLIGEPKQDVIHADLFPETVNHTSL